MEVLKGLGAGRAVRECTVQPCCQSNALLRMTDEPPLARRVTSCAQLTLQPSHVMAPKWKPDDGAPQTLHGMCAICDDTFVPPGDQTDSKIRIKIRRNTLNIFMFYQDVDAKEIIMIKLQ